MKWPDRIVARHGHVDGLIASEDAAQGSRIAQPLDRQPVA